MTDLSIRIRKLIISLVFLAGVVGFSVILWKFHDSENTFLNGYKLSILPLGILALYLVIYEGYKIAKARKVIKFGTYCKAEYIGYDYESYRLGFIQKTNLLNVALKLKIVIDGKEYIKLTEHIFPYSITRNIQLSSVIHICYSKGLKDIVVVSSPVGSSNTFWGVDYNNEDDKDI